MNKHTPGPWAVGFHDGSGCGSDNEGAYITAGDHANVLDSVNTVVVRGGVDTWNVKLGVLRPEDACLISAAPDLLRELKDIRDRFRRALVASGTDDWFADAAVASADAVIAKAEVQS